MYREGLYIPSYSVTHTTAISVIYYVLKGIKSYRRYGAPNGGNPSGYLPTAAEGVDPPSTPSHRSAGEGARNSIKHLECGRVGVEARKELSYAGAVWDSAEGRSPRIPVSGGEVDAANAY